jgi:beta-galactosidase
MNIGVDFIDPSSRDIDKYKLILVPALYSSPDSILRRLNQYVKNGGHIIYTFKSGFSDEHNKVRTVSQPGIISEACGIKYSEFTKPEDVGLKGKLLPDSIKNSAEEWMELVTPVSASVLLQYDHPIWGKYAAITENKYGKGTALYVACGITKIVKEKLLEKAVKDAGLWNVDQEIKFPLITKSGINGLRKKVHYYLNYSAEPKEFVYPYAAGKELLTSESVSPKSRLKLSPWGFVIIEEN